MPFNPKLTASLPQTIEEFVRPRLLPRREEAPAHHRAKHAWLVCCSSVFLLDLAAGVVWASSDQSLLPLIAMVLSDDPPAQEAQRPPADLSAAHGHVSLMD
jgi:hypothetical protein